MTMQRMKLAAAAAIAALGAWGVMQHGANRTPAPAGAPAHAAAQPVPGNGNNSGNNNSNNNSNNSWFSALGSAPLAGTVPADPVPLAQQVDTLAASGTPEDKYRAYNLIDDCMTFQRLGTLPFLHFPDARDMTGAEKAAEAKVCTSLTELHRRARIEYLAAAARAGVMGADTAFMVAGPFGDRDALNTRPDDPLVIEWKQQALEQLTRQAMNGDLGSLNTLWTGHLSGWLAIPKDPVLAYTYHSALQRIDQQQNPHVADGPYSGNMFAFLKDNLTPEQIAAANAQAERIAQNFRQRLETQKARQ